MQVCTTPAHVALHCASAAMPAQEGTGANKARSSEVRFEESLDCFGMLR